MPIDAYRSPKQDKTVILQVGDHEFIKVSSFVNYGLAKVTSIKYIDRLIEEGEAKSKAPMSQDILTRIREGVRKSKRTPNEVLIAYSNHMDTALGRRP